MRYHLLFLLTLILLPYAAADDILDAFSQTADVAPPNIPSIAEEQEIEELQDMNILLVDMQDNPIGNVHVLLEYKDGEPVRKLAYVDDTGILIIDSIEPGTYALKLKADSLETAGSDYFAEVRLQVPASKDTTLKLYPVGSVRGVVKLDDELVSNAKVQMECSGLYGDFTQITTDEFGSYSANWLPIGACSIKARKGNIAGSADVMIEKGLLKQADIELKTGISLGLQYSYVIGALLLLLIAVVIFIYLRSGRDKKEIKKAKVVEQNKRFADVLATLNPKEREVAEMIYKEEEVMQSKIVHGLMIPKTTLVRMLETLKKKKIISIEKHGKAKKIKLTDWILEKEENKDK